MKVVLSSFLIMFLGLGIKAQDSFFQIQYQLDVKVEKDTQAVTLKTSPATESSSEKLVINLSSNSSFSIQNEKLNSLHEYDFDRAVIIKRKTDSTLDVIPLHSDLEYRIAEYQNRTYLNKIVTAGGVEEAFGGLVTLESIFGIEDEKQGTRNGITSTNRNDTITYKFNDKELLSILYSNKEVPKEYIKSFSKYLVYELDIHPKIKEEIINKKMLPAYISYSQTNAINETSKQFSLQDAKLTDSVEFTLDSVGMKFAQRNTSQIEGIIDSMYNYSLANSFESTDSTFHLNAANKLYEAGKNLSGLLCLFEYLLTTGNQPRDQINKITEQAANDPDLSTFLSCLNAPTTKEEAEVKISLLDELIDKDIEFGYIMNIFAGNYIQPIDETKALLYFKKVLNRNPSITGLWLDLGEAYAHSYEFSEAWKCFEIMLALDDDHGMRKKLIDRKKQLETEFPSYF